nr:hypothetical protein [Tanacetum cinerariifolium]
MINAQIADLSSHNTKYTSPALTQKVFSNMRRVGKGFSKVETPLFDGMLVPQKVKDDVAPAIEDKDVANEISTEPTLPLPTPATTPPSPQQDLIPSSPQVESTLHPLPHQAQAGGKIVELDANKDIRLETLDAENTDDTNEAEPAEVKEVLEVVTAAKMMTEVVTTATTITAAQVPKASTPRRRKGVVIRDPKETATASVIMHSQAKSKDKGKGILKGEKEIEEEGSKRKSKSSEQKATKKQRIDEEVKELKTYLQIIADDDDDVFIEATPLAKKVPVVDYYTHNEDNKPYYKIIRADRTHKLFLSFITIMKKFDREDSEMLWKLVQERF